jgi:hypothetical protein
MTNEIHYRLRQEKDHLLHIECNKLIYDYPPHYDLAMYNTSVGFFAFNDNDRFKVFEKLCYEEGFKIMRRTHVVNTEHGFIVKKRNHDLNYNINIFVMKKNMFSNIQGLENIFEMKTRRDVYTFHISSIDSCHVRNKNIISPMVNILIPAGLFDILNRQLQSRNMTVMRVIFFDTDEVYLKIQKIKTRFIWIENRFYSFKSSLFKKILNDIDSVTGFYNALFVNYYDNFYREEESVKIDFYLPRKHISKETFKQILYNINYISNERRESVCKKIEDNCNDSCAICLKDFSREKLIGLTPCCYSSICCSCCMKMNCNNVSKCFICKKKIDYCNDIMFINLSEEDNIQVSIEELIEDYDPDLKYVVITDNISLKKQDNVLVLNNLKDLDKLKQDMKYTDCVLFTKDIPDNIKEKLCYFTENIDVKVYETYKKT